MFGLRFPPDYGVLVHHFFVLISSICARAAMFLSRSASFQWLRRRFHKRGNPHVSNNNGTGSVNASANAPPEAVECGAAAPQLSAAANSNNKENNLAEVLVLNDTKIDTVATVTTATTTTTPVAVASNSSGASTALTTVGVRASNVSSASDSGMSAAPGKANKAANDQKTTATATAIATAPIARVETEEDCACGGGGSGGNAECNQEMDVAGNSAVKRSKSRVRTYIRKCKERFTGQHHQHAVATPAAQQKTTTTTTSATTPTTTSTTHVSADIENQLASVQEAPESTTTSTTCEEHEENYMAAASIVVAATVEEEEEEEVLVHDEALDIEARSTHSACPSLSGAEDRLAAVLQTETGTEALIDSYLSHIFPRYVECTRAVLVRQARDMLVCTYQGCLHSFEQQFLCKYAEIAAQLQRTHATGESLIWRAGWPLATPSGELILHLGCLDEALLRPADIYLCVKADSCNVPQLQAFWRAASSEAAVQSCCIDLTLTTHLSALTLEMLSGDELPQLLQSLLVGVERTITRISLNELQMPAAAGQHQHQQQHKQLLSTVTAAAATAVAVADATNNNQRSSSNSQHNESLTSSPKCALKRSELITRSKTLGGKYMLRRLTNRQDSMNSTSSGNSCGSSGSNASSDELLCYNMQNINNNNNNNNAEQLPKSKHSQSQQQQQPPQQTASTSPALPLFCLGNSFPHIDSDEENADEKRNSLDAEQFESEIVPPSSINEIPGKLLLSGIELPGSHDLKGQRLVTVDAESVSTAGLNCYEIATVLLYYSTIPQSDSTEHRAQAATTTTTTTITTTSTAATINATTLESENTQHQQYQQQHHTAFTILIAIEQSHHLCVVDLICQSLKLLRRQVVCCEILAVCLERNLLEELRKPTVKPCGDSSGDSKLQPQQQQQQQQQQQHKQQQLQQHLSQEQQQHLVKFISVDEVTTSVAPSQLPHGKLQGCHYHDARKWREFFGQLEPFQRLCAAAGQRLVTAMSDIRSADLQGLPTRRQLYAQHRALSRALMDSELHNVRKRGKATLLRLRELAHSIGRHTNGGSVGALKLPATKAANNSYNYSNNNNNNNNSSFTNSSQPVRSQYSSNKSSLMTSCDNHSGNNNSNNHNNNNGRNHNSSNSLIEGSGNMDVAIRLQKVTLLFNEVDRAAKRLEQLTEQRRERLRELTRQRALEDEISEVTSWLTSDGSETLQRFANVQLDCEAAVKEYEHDFEKYYFISMKHLAKGRDLHVAATKTEALRDSAVNLKAALDCFAEKLEQARERIEGASRLHHLIAQRERDEGMQQEMHRLAEQIGMPGLLDKCRGEGEQEQPHLSTAAVGCEEAAATRTKPNSLNLSGARKPYAMALYASTAAQKSHNRLSHRSSSGIGSFEAPTGCQCWRESRNLEDMDEFLGGAADADDEEDGDGDGDGEEEQSKIADSGLGGCERCEGNPKLTRVCSCQSLNEAANMYDKSDELDDECFERPSKPYLSIHSPMEANAHLQCHASSLELPKLEELSCLDAKIQKTLLLIMREMIGTERDYVRSLYYVIENYVDELLRDDIPQPLRGQRNVIFGNIEKIFEFHNSHFLSELERYEYNPLKVGAAFLEMESKFYLYALYNKNKPKSDTLMSEYGTAFFKSKQFELTDKMDLASYLLKPVQRMGKYALLLQQLVKACNSVEGSALQEIAADVEELQRAEEMVKFQLRHGNDLLAMDSLRDCDVNVKEQGRLLRQNEFLVWQGRGGKKSLRQIFLFEELVLFSKARRFPDHKNLDIYIYKNSIKTSDIGLTAHAGDSPTKFEIWFRKRKPEDTWTMQCMSEDIKNAWTEEVSKLLWKQAKRNREIRLAEMSSMGIGSKPCLDIRPSNNQINDRSITITQLGKAPKLRHSFVALQTESTKTSRRPNSLISESSLSSGTSSSSLSTGSSSGHERTNKPNGNNQALELINETQALVHVHSSGSNNTNTLSSGCSSGGLSGNLRNHKRSTTLVSQLSMESGILSDISMTPDQEPADATTWSALSAATTPTGNTTSPLAPTTTTVTTATVVMRRQKLHRPEVLQKELPAELLCDSNSNPYIKNKDETINL